MPLVRVDSIDIEFESFGRDEDPVILLIMGYSAQLTRWPESLCHRLADRRFRVIRFDNRDVGKSTHLLDMGTPDLAQLAGRVAAGETPCVPYTLDDMARDAVGLLDALAIESAHIVGASMGGMIAQLIAIDCPQKLKSLVSIMSTTGRRDLPPADSRTMAALVVPAKDSREGRIQAEIRKSRVLAGPAYPESEAQLRALAERQVDRSPLEPTGLARQMAAMITAPPRHERLRAVHAPALIIHGAADPLILPACGEDTAANIPGADLIVIPGAGHDIPESLVPLYLRYLGDFVAQAEASSAA